MAGSPAAKRYAKALHSLAADTGAAETVEADMRLLQAYLAGSPLLVQFVTSPVIPPERQLSTLKTLFADSLQELTQRFLAMLVRKQRLPLLEPICDIYLGLCDDERGVVHATITAGRPLTDSQVEAICRRLAEKTGKTIQPHVEVDGSLLGGFKVKVGDLVTDLTLSHQLERLQERILNA